jgi:uncharacterized protein
MKPFNSPVLARTLICLFLIWSLESRPVAAAEALDPAGHWEGDITLPATKLAIRVDLEKAPDGKWSGTIDIPVQGLRGFKLDPVAVEGAAVRFAMPQIPGDPSFAGRLESDAKVIRGDFTQGGQKFPFSVSRKPRPEAKAGWTPSHGIPGKGLVGYWQGSLSPTPVIQLRLAVEITNGAAGALGGIMTSLDQGGARMPLSASVEKSVNVKLQVPAIGGGFEGVMATDGSEITGDWLQAGRKLPLVLKRVAAPPVLARPQDPKPPYPYAEEQVVIENPTAGTKLAGTLTVPRSAGPHPVVVLITGSGPQDRDEALMGHRPFLVLSDHLTRTGIAVLRCDDRGVGKSTGSFAKAVDADFVTDAIAQVAWLKARPDIDPKRIGLVGHSEGGVVAPLAAVKQPQDIAFIVLLAGVGVPMEQLLIRQGTDIARAMGASEDQIAKSAAIQQQIFPLLKAATNSVEAQKVVREVTAKALAEFTPDQRRSMGLSDDMLESQSQMVATPWFRNLLAYDPRPTLRQVKCPVLAINGEKDLQVAAKENLKAIREALEAGGNHKVKTVELPGLNHLFQTCTTGAISEYGQIDETFSPAALKVISDWIRQQAGLGN